MKDAKDLLAESKSSQEKLWEDWPEQMSAFVGFSNSVKTPSVLEPKVKFLIAVGLAVKSQCDWCIAAHISNALEAGATKQEILEASWMAVLMGGGPCLMYMQVVQKALEDLAG